MFEATNTYLLAVAGVLVGGFLHQPQTPFVYRRGAEVICPFWKSITDCQLSVRRVELATVGQREPDRDSVSILSCQSFRTEDNALSRVCSSLGNNLLSRGTSLLDLLRLGKEVVSHF